MLLSEGWQVAISDCNIDLAKQFADEHNAKAGVQKLQYTACDTASWDSQVDAFKAALRFLGGRIDFVAPIAGIGEKKWLPTFEALKSSGPGGEFEKPNLSIVEVDLTGVLYTVALAVQQFQRQEPTAWSENAQSQYRGKIGLVASVCGFYCVPALPIYTAAKHALVGLTRSYGTLLKDEGITISAVAPNVIRTNISSNVFYDQLERKGLLTPMTGVLDAFKEILGGDESGQVYECGTNGSWSKRQGAEYLDEESEKCCVLLQERAKGLHYD
jgi:NAD(P)-dependent dehydrogenase (short-subunit alcohol dehydrogenase family)